MRSAFDANVATRGVAGNDSHEGSKAQSFTKRQEFLCSFLVSWCLCGKAELITGFAATLLAVALEQISHPAARDSK